MGRVDRAALVAAGIRQPLACKNFDEGLGGCVVEEMDDPDVDCDVPVDEANCDTDQQPTDFWGQAKKCEPSPLLHPLPPCGTLNLYMYPRSGSIGLLWGFFFPR